MSKANCPLSWKWTSWNQLKALIEKDWPPRRRRELCQQTALDLNCNISFSGYPACWPTLQILDLSASFYNLMSQFLKINLAYYKYKYSTMCIITNIHIHILLVLLFWSTLTNIGFFVLPFELVGCALNLPLCRVFVFHFLVIHENTRLTFSEIFL